MTNNQAIAYLEAIGESTIAMELIRARQKRDKLAIRSMGIGPASVSWFKGFGMRNVTVRWNGRAVLKIAVKA